MRCVADDGFDLSGESDELRHCRVDAGAGPHPRQPLQLRADQERVDPARVGGEFGVVQDHAAIAPLAVVAEEGIDLRRSAGRAVGRAGLPGAGSQVIRPRQG